MQELKSNNAVFAAFKTHREQNDLAALLTDESGNLRSFNDFRKTAEPVIGQYNTNWLATEYTTAVKSARMAVRFKSYERDSDLFPNVRWLPSRANKPRKEHIPYYRTVRSLSDPWFKTHYPGCVWGCQCDMENTADSITHVGDYPVTMASAEAAESSPETRSAGIDRNPAFTGSIFSDTHPYVTEAYPNAERAVMDFVTKILGKWKRKTSKN